MKNILLTLFVSASLTSCLVYGDSTDQQYTSLREIECVEKPSEIYLFFEGEQVDFKYEKVGLIEIQGAEFDDNEKLISDLKHKAWNNCANGVIKIEQQFKLRNEGVLFASETETTYSSKVFLGIAVLIETNDAFLSKYQSHAIKASDQNKELRASGNRP